MAKNKRSRDEAETYESDGGFVSNDDGNAPKSKKSKKTGVNKSSSGGDDQFWAVYPTFQPVLVVISNQFIAFIRQKPSTGQRQ